MTTKIERLYFALAVLFVVMMFIVFLAPPSFTKDYEICLDLFFAPIGGAILLLIAREEQKQKPPM